MSDFTPAEAENLRLKLLLQMRELDAKLPGEQTFASIIKQLEYVGEFILSDATSIPRMKDLNFGFLGMRFVYEFDQEIGGSLAEFKQYLERRWPSGE